MIPLSTSLFSHWVNTFMEENAKEVRKAAHAAGEICSTYVCHYQIFDVKVSVFGSHQFHTSLKVHKREKFFVSDFEFFIIL